MSHEDDEQERPPQAETDNPSPAEDGDDAAAAAADETGASEDDAASSEASPAAARRPRWYRVGQLILPPLLAAGAVGVHWKLNVPDKILESPNDQGSKKRKKKKNKRSAKTGKAGRDRRAKNRHAPRSAEQLDEAWTQFAETPFDDEPIRAPWARRNQALINRAMVVARRAVFEGAPEEPRTVLASTKCRTVRCRFVVRSPYQHELETLRGGLERLEFEGESAWRSFEAKTIEPPEGMDEEEHYLEVVVGMASDEVGGSGLEVPSSAEDADPDDDAKAEADAGAELEAPPKSAQVAPAAAPNDAKTRG
ncbi:MAG: hypothetical protein AAF799_30370 [Myxococcota bacterium]